MRIGVENADAVITVSEQYRKEIISGPAGEGLQELLAARKDSVYAILNGMDTEKYNPETDKELLKCYREVCGKALNKTSLQKELGLFVGDDRFLIGNVSRMVEQKGLDLIQAALPDLMEIPSIQFVFLGDGEPKYMAFLEEAQKKYAGRFALIPGFNTGGISHRVYAASDAYLMPSRFEPCGISQLIAMRYGAVPIVRYTGGLKTTVSDEVGFGFEQYSAYELLETIKMAEQMFRESRNEWNIKANRAMQKDYSFKNSVKEYEKLFIKLLHN